MSYHEYIFLHFYRKEQKKYGTGKLIEGVYEEGKTKCLILEDVVTTGSSIVETAQALRDHGILVDNAIVILNRNHPAADENLKNNGITLTSMVKVDHLLQVLQNSGKIDQAKKLEVETLMANGQEIPTALPPSTRNGIYKSVTQKLEGNAKLLFDIILSKQSNLCLSADCENWQDVLQVTEAVASKICAVKTHVDAINFENRNDIEVFKTGLVNLAKQNNFIIIEDRKFADIGSTVEKQLIARPFTISTWADFVTVHSIPGPGMLKVFKAYNKGVILIAEMSSSGNIPSLLPEYKDKTLEMCKGYEDTVVGFVSQSRVGSSMASKDDEQVKNNCYLQFTPGVSLESTGDSLGQQYVTVKDAVLKRDADVIIVGRGIVKQPQEKWLEVAEEYRKQGWEAFSEKIGS